MNGLQSQINAEISGTTGDHHLADRELHAGPPERKIRVWVRYGSGSVMGRGFRVPLLPSILPCLGSPLKEAHARTAVRRL